jgi:solute carrier family 25 oxoglutarate transporter 11
MNFVIGGLSGMIATSIIQPIDCIKVQIQLRSEGGGKNLSPFQIAKDIYSQNKSVKPFYAGLDSALLRQAVYTSTRLGLFYTIKDEITKKNGGKAPSAMQNAFASLVSGAIGSFVGNPADLSLVRMQNDLNLPKEERRNYKHVGDALARTVKEEGVFALWRGSLPTVCRAMSMNFSLLVPFEGMKKVLTPYINDVKTRTIAASLCSGVVAAIISLPFDNVKTKLQKMKAGADGVMPYKGVIDCMQKTSKLEGPSKLWVGIVTYYFRVAPHAVISLVTNDYLRSNLIKPKK